MKIGNHIFHLGSRTHIVAVLNVTPDSFSDGGQFNSVEKAMAQAKKLVAEGADIIEIGGESTRPGHQPVSLQEELDRVIPVVNALLKTMDTPLCVDTQKPAVADAVLALGVPMLNDISCLADPQLAHVAANYQAVFVLMHNRPDPNDRTYTPLVPSVIKDLQAGIDRLIAAGLPKEKIIIDPGIGFAKSQDEYLEILRHLSAFKALPYPLFIGASRKRFMEHALGLPLDQRKEATMAVTAHAANQFVDFIRVHDVLENKRVATMIDHLVRYQH